MTGLLFSLSAAQIFRKDVRILFVGVIGAYEERLRYTRLMCLNQAASASGLARLERVRQLRRASISHCSVPPSRVRPLTQFVLAQVVLSVQRGMCALGYMSQTPKDISWAVATVKLVRLSYDAIVLRDSHKHWTKRCTLPEHLQWQPQFVVRQSHFEWMPLAHPHPPIVPSLPYLVSTCLRVSS